MEGTMRRAVLMAKDGPWEIQEMPIPKPGPDQVLIKLKASSICNQTDLNTIKGYHPPHDHQLREMKPHDLRRLYKTDPDPLADFYPATPYPFPSFPTYMGHEGAGEVVEVGEVKSSFGGGFKVGDKVAMIFLQGGFGEYAVCDNSQCTLMADRLSYEEASLFEPCSIIYNTVSFVMKPADTVVILGQGGLGLLTTQYARVYGAHKIIVSEPIPFKRELAKKFGADYVIDPTTTNVVREIERITNGRGADTIFECAGVPETIQAIPYISKRGMVGARVGQIGACCEPVLVDWSYIHFNGLTVYSNRSKNNPPTPEQLEAIMRSMDSDRIDLKSLITHRYKLDDIEQAFKDVESGQVVKGIFTFD